MSIKSKILAAAATLTLAGGAGLATAGTAQATTFSCVFSNGCGALHGVNAAGDAIAVDAKYQNPDEMAIGYPDLAGDSATNVALVAHEQRRFGTRTWADTGIQVNDLHSVSCSIPVIVPTGGGDSSLVFTAAAGDTLSPPSPVVDSGASTVQTFTIHDPAVNCTATETVTNSGSTAGSNLAATEAITSNVVDGQTIGRSYPVGGVLFNDSSQVTGAFTYPGIPAGVSETTSVVTDDMFSVSGSTAAPGTYSSEGVTYTDSNGASQTDAFSLVVSGNRVFAPGPASTFYTIVFAKNGYWSSQCLTVVGAVGKVRFAPCTLGRDAGQRFYAYSGGVPVAADILGGGTYSFRSGEAGGFLEDASSNPSPITPQSDFADSILPGGRQLDVNGAAPVQADELWTWSS